ncbi:MAG: helix-turn-helix domain-containing protein, partial [Egibacteraceae bacterium]
RCGVDAGLSTSGLASAVGLSQSKVSKVENAQQSVRRDHVEAWLDVCDVTGPQRAQLLDLAEDALVEASTWWREHRTGLRAKQLRVARLEAQAARIREFQPGIIPGLAQTPDYAAAMLRFFNVTSQHDVAAAVTARLDRQAILHSPTAVELLIGEVALRWEPSGQTGLLAAQLDRLTQLTRTAGVRLGLVRANAPSPPQLGGFAIYDHDGELTTVCETLTGEATYADPRDTHVYVEMFTQLSAVALFDQDARGLLTELIEQL